MALLRYFDDERTLELKKILREFLEENGVGIALYPSKKWEDTFEYSLIGFKSVKQQAKYFWGKKCKDIPLESIHSLNDAFIALTNLKLHDKFLDFELSVIFDEQTGEISVEFFKEVPEEGDARKGSHVQYFFDSRTLEIVEVLKKLDCDSTCGIMVYPVDQEETKYACNVFDYIETDSGRKIQMRKDMKAIPLEHISSFDDIVLAMSNAKIHDVGRNFEMYYGTEKKFGHPALMFAKN